MKTIQDNTGYVTFVEGIRTYDIFKGHVTSIKMVGASSDSDHDSVAVCTNDTDVYPHKGSAIVVMKPSEWALASTPSVPFADKEELRGILLDYFTGKSRKVKT
jgi:hypothetical protein